MLPTTLDIDSLWDYSDPQETERKFCEVLLQIPEDEPEFLELLTQIARAQGLQHKFNKAHQTLDQVERRLGTAVSREKIRYLLERGRVLNASGRPEESRPYFEKALETATQLAQDSYAVDALHMLAIVAPPASSLDFNLLAIQLAESSRQAKARGWLGSLYNNTGWSYHGMGEYASALEMFEKAETVRRSDGSANEIRVARWCAARALRSLNRFEEALSKQLQLETEFESAGETDGYVFEEIGECLLALHCAKKARPYFAKAYDALSQNEQLAEKDGERLARLKNLAR